MVGIESTVLRSHARPVALVSRRLGIYLLRLLVAASLFVSAAATQIAFESPLRYDATTETLSSVAVGSTMWDLGLRPGQHAELRSNDDPADGVRVELGDGATIETEFALPVAAMPGLAIALALIAAAFAGARLGLPGRTLLLGLGAAAALAPLTPVLGYPTGAILAIVPPVAALLAMWTASTEARRARRRMAFAAICLIALLMSVIAAAVIAPGLGWRWDWLWLAPTITVCGVALIAAAPALRRFAAADANVALRFDRLIAEAFPAVRASRLDGSAEERARVALELHNEVLPLVGQALMEMDANEPTARNRLVALADRLRTSLTGRQETVLEWAGLCAAVESYASTLGPSVTALVDDGGSRAPKLVEHAAYRIAQLALSNAVAHSSADRIGVTVSETDRVIRVEVVDDGVGIDELAARTALTRGHIGLAEMRAQAAQAHGSLEIESRRDAGTSVRFVWPG